MNYKLQLEQLRDKAQMVSGGWNGEDEVFYVEDRQYKENDAHIADDIVNKATAIIELLDEIEL